MTWTFIAYAAVMMITVLGSYAITQLVSRRSIETIPRPPQMFAHPYLLCPECQNRVTNVRHGDGPAQNLPCGHRTGGYDTVCPSWGPVDGCECPGGPSSHRRAIYPAARRGVLDQVTDTGAPSEDAR